MELGPQVRELGYRLELFSLLKSTNDTALQRARLGDPGLLWIVAGQQDGGRGRMQRPWASPEGNLYATLLLADPAPQALAPQLGFVAGVALADAVNQLLPAANACLKWPNDLLIAGAKVSGLLIEATTAPGGGFFCAIGFGVNCASAPADTPYPAACLAAAGGPSAPAIMFEALSRSVPIWLSRWRRGANFAEIRAAWLERALPAGSSLQVRSGDRITTGTFSTIDAHGRLVLECGDQSMTFDAGDVFPVGTIGLPEFQPNGRS